MSTGAAGTTRWCPRIYIEQARDIVLEYLGLNKDKYMVIFCTPRRAELLKAQLKPRSYQSVSSQDIGLPLGVRALAVERKALPRGVPFQTGGGTARLVSPGWVIWAKAPDKFEAGTPAIVNVIAFARALQLIQHFGKDAFQDAAAEKLAATEILYHDELEKYSGRELLDELRQTLIGRGVRVPTVEGARPYHQPGQRRQHAHLHADMERCLPDMAPAQASTARDHS